MMIIYTIQWLNYPILWSKKTELITIVPPIRNKIVGTSPKIKNVNNIPNIGNNE